MRDHDAAQILRDRLLHGHPTIQDGAVTARVSGLLTLRAVVLAAGDTINILGGKLTLMDNTNFSLISGWVRFTGPVYNTFTGKTLRVSILVFIVSHHTALDGTRTIQVERKSQSLAEIL